MKDRGIDKGLVKEFETSKKEFKGMFGFRKLFWDYLNKLNVPFSDPCCETASDSVAPVGLNSEGELVYWDKDIKQWVLVNAPATTTTTTSSSTTTTTTVG